MEAAAAAASEKGESIMSANPNTSKSLSLDHLAVQESYRKR